MTRDPKPTAGLYLHVPFCKKLCLYCDFYSRIAKYGEIEKYIDAIASECRLRSDFDHCRFDTVFLGGGTPSLLESAQIISLFNHLRSKFDIAIDSEITIECNPSSVDCERLDTYREIGINRISLGVQTFIEKHLKTLGRLHDSQGAIKAFELIRTAGFENVSIDLIYGLPNQTVPEWQSDLNTAISLNPTHISAYNLIIEPDTPFGKLYQQGKLSLPSEEIQSAMYEMLNESLCKVALSRYEISNFAKPGYECRHNLKYWHLEPFLGLGPAAFSFDGATRRQNAGDLDSYLKAFSDNITPPHELEHLDKAKLLEETIMMSLRLSEGLSLSHLQDCFGYDLRSAKSAEIKSLVNSGYLIIDSDRIKLAPKALFISDEILVKLI